MSACHWGHEHRSRVWLSIDLSTCAVGASALASVVTGLEGRVFQVYTAIGAAPHMQADVVGDTDRADTASGSGSGSVGTPREDGGGATGR
ncbi:hypothetical protein MBM_02279 [Drepanopeziza brunnea f. sp. 'multigermtubi' MB_m1]|uniref:Uncharacterized protein n=1 Tax=Marssonina brunnea f. sp. multigermtubi (strain MB_m1) TaxID=1072389 RepID=K1X226_MARBU|nr:uncharacterized protein MBM_02279 [Drepanopeziza brunnea f. sp. 'multigermtubi' MB_m1]EKD19042.1 hypothetical protein MBM_02279 [Drepanopeziza brunnea f. sp. 'multigermtubi' MB_m1]